MCTWRSARITPEFSSTTPCGPTRTQPGVSWWSPLIRTGRSIPSEMASVCQLDLRSAAAGAKHPNFGKHTATRTDDRHRLFGGEEPVLVELFLDFELRALAEQRLEMLLRQVH